MMAEGMTPAGDGMMMGGDMMMAPEEEKMI